MKWKDELSFPGNLPFAGTLAMCLQWPLVVVKVKHMGLHPSVLCCSLDPNHSRLILAVTLWITVVPGASSEIWLEKSWPKGMYTLKDAEERTWSKCSLVLTIQGCIELPLGIGFSIWESYSAKLKCATACHQNAAEPTYIEGLMGLK